MTDMTAFERQVAGEMLGRAGPVRPVDDLAVFESVTATSRAHRWEFMTFAALKFVAAAVIVALFGGILLAGVLTTPQADDMAPAAVTESPSPMTTEELLSRMITEEVEPGIFRVVNDGVRDLSPAGNHYLVVGQDGSIWLASHSGDLSKFGVAETHDWQLSQDEYLMDLEVAPDGKVWVVARSDEGSTLRSFDGEEWADHAAVDTQGFTGDVEIASNGVIWAVLSDGVLGYLDTDKSMWRTVAMPMALLSFEGSPGGLVATESGVWARQTTGILHYADGAWERILYGHPETGAMPGGVVWGIGSGPTGSGETLYRHDETGWRSWSLTEQRMLGGWRDDPTAVAPDGSFWVAWPGRGAPGTPDVLGVNRFDGQTWERFLPGMSVSPSGMDVAPDGSVWLIAWDEESRDAGPFDPATHLYVITPEAVPAVE